MPQPRDRDFEINDSTVQDTNVVQGDNTHAVQGSDNQTVIGNQNFSVDGQGNVIYYNQIPAEKRPRLERSLLSSVEKEVNDRLRQSLHNRVFIELGKQQVPETIRRPWDADVKVGNQAPEPIPDGKTIIDVFRRDDVAGKLLILGHPGAGKTTTMLELAAALIEWAKQDVEQPIPVLFNLSSWRDDKQPIADWLVQELKAKYGVSAALGKEWLAARKLSPLLDGLDELKNDRPKNCVEAINHWLLSEQRSDEVVVCSRWDEYNTYGTLLELSGAIRLQPLKPEQIQQYLTQTEKHDLWPVISQDPAVLDLLKVPLWLSVLTLAHGNLDLVRWQKATTEKERLTLLLDGYVISRLEIPLNSRYYKLGKAPTSQQTRRWLVWLAQNMNQDEFLIEQMQPNLLIARREKWQMRFIVALIIGLVVELTAALIEGLVVGLSWGVIWGLLRGLREIEPVELLKINFSCNTLKIIFRNLSVAMGWGIIVGFTGGLIISLMAGIVLLVLSWGLIVGLISGLIWGVIWGLVESFKVDIQSYVKPNQGILNSGRNTLTLLIFALPVAIFLFWCLPLLLASVSTLDNEQIVTVTGIGVAILFLKTGYSGGGGAYLRHYALRFVLARSGKIPYLYANFLNYCTERLLLQRVGGRFRFLHRTLQEHFAAMPLEYYGRGMKP